MMCSANVGGDPVNGCENECVPGEDLCQMHLNQVEPDHSPEYYKYRGRIDSRLWGIVVG